MLSLPRIVLVATLLSVAGSYSPIAAQPVSSARPDAASAQPLAVTLDVLPKDAGKEWGRTLLPAAGSHFPAFSSDGTTVVHLINEHEDFTGIPLATVVFWTKKGKVDSFRLTSVSRGEVDAKQTRREAKILAAINARLATKRWRPLPLADHEADDEDGKNRRLRIDGVTFPVESLAKKFPAPGVGNGQGAGPTCGEVVGIDEGFGSRELGFAVFLPQPRLGGDSCKGRPHADLAIVLPVR